MSSVGTSFRLAPMSRLILILTVGLWALPIALLASAVFQPARAAPALLLVAIYAWAWLRFRPTRFVVHPATLEVVWPLNDWVVHACRRGRPLGRIWLVVDPTSRDRADVHLTHGSLRVDRTRERATVADFTGTTRGIHARACAVGLLTLCVQRCYSTHHTRAGTFAVKGAARRRSIERLDPGLESNLGWA